MSFHCRHCRHHAMLLHFILNVYVRIVLPFHFFHSTFSYMGLIPFPCHAMPCNCQPSTDTWLKFTWKQESRHTYKYRRNGKWWMVKVRMAYTRYKKLLRTTTQKMFLLLFYDFYFILHFSFFFLYLYVFPPS